MVKIDLNQFWATLEASELLTGMDLASMKARIVDRNDPPEKAASRASRWLTEQKLITRYQSEILMAGHSGPFKFGNYLIQGSANGDLSDIFLAVHSATRFPVWLHFFPGNQPEDLSVWNNVESKATELDQLRHPSLVPVYETVVTPTHRFLVTGVPGVSKLADKLPRKSRLPWAKTCPIMARVAAALDALHAKGIAHENVSYDSIWIGGESIAQLHLPFNEMVRDEDTTKRANDDLEREQKIKVDIRDFGETLFHMTTGRSIRDNQDILKLEKDKFAKALARFELPAELIQLIFKTIHINDKTDGESSDDPTSAKHIRDQLLNLSKNKFNPKYRPTKTELVFQNGIDQWSPQLSNDSVAEVPGINTQSKSDLANNLKSSPPQQAEKIRNAIAAAEHRRQSKWKIPAVIGGALLAFSLLIAAGAFIANQKMIDVIPQLVDNDSAQPTHSNVDLETDVAQTNPGNANTKKVWLIQELVADDQKTLWESPTSGPPVSLEYLPSAPQLIAVVNWDSFLASGEGKPIIESLGPHFRSIVTEFVVNSGFQLSDLGKTTFSLHSNEAFEYESFAVVNLKEPTPPAECLNKWGNPDSIQLGDGKTLFVKPDKDLAIWVINDSVPSEELSDNPNLVQKFIVGKRAWVEQVANGEAPPVSGSLNRMAIDADNDRHINLFFLRSALFNDEGKDLMGNWASWVQPELRLLIPDEMRAGTISLHVDHGSYLELRLDQQIEIKPEAMAKTLKMRLQQQRDLIGPFVSGLASNSYWDQIRMRYDQMLSELTTHWRWDVEFGDVVANAWLPPMAAPNLIAGSELSLSFSRSQQVSATAASDLQLPKNLTELLATKRSLKITNPPDLNVLLSDIQSEVRDQYLQLPFEFNIRLMGNDLQKEGITQNQRPGELNIEDKSLADILTSVMTSSNPNRNITGADDPNCKLVWVVAADPEDESRQAVLITTRAAAQKKGYTLPPAFVEQ